MRPALGDSLRQEQSRDVELEQHYLEKLGRQSLQVALGGGWRGRHSRSWQRRVRMIDFDLECILLDTPVPRLIRSDLGFLKLV